MNPSLKITAAALTLFAAAACAQTTTAPTPPPTTTPATAPAQMATTLPAAPTDPAVIALLERLEKLGTTLSDFSADVDYQVYHNVTEDSDGNDGTVQYVKDMKTGEVKFTITFTTKKSDGKIKKKGLNHQFIFDGRNFYDIDWVEKIHKQTQLVKPGDPPANVLKTDGPVPLPIGQKVADILAEFNVAPALDSAGKPVADSLVLTPLKKGKLSFTKLTLLLDAKTDLPVEITSEHVNQNDVTTIKLKSVVVNSGKVSVNPPATPKSDSGWAIEIKPY